MGDGRSRRNEMTVFGIVWGSGVGGGRGGGGAIAQC